MKNYRKIFLITSSLVFNIGFAMQSQKMVIAAPVVSLRIEPKPFIAGQEHDPIASKNMFGRFYDKFMKLLPAANRDPRQDTQLLYNERIVCLEELPDGWLKVKAIEQCTFNPTTKQWDYVQGYIQNNKDLVKTVTKFKPLNLVVCKKGAFVSIPNKPGLQLSLGTKLNGALDLHNNYKINLVDGNTGFLDANYIWEIGKSIKKPVEKIRAKIVDCAKQMIGSDYSWGGRSFCATTPGGLVCKTDCSGFVNLAYRCAGFELPRNSNHIFLKSKKIEDGNQLLPADCIFFAPIDRPEKVGHVLLYIGNDEVIESCIAKGVCISSAQERFGKSLATLHYGDKITVDGVDYLIYFGSFLNDATLLRELHTYATAVYDL